MGKPPPPTFTTQPPALHAHFLVALIGSQLAYNLVLSKDAIQFTVGALDVAFGYEHTTSCKCMHEI